MPTVASAEVDAEAQKQADLALKLRMDDQTRVLAVAYRLMTANAELCPSSKPTVGLFVTTIDGIPKPMRTAASRSMGLTAAPAVIWTPPESSADKAGLKAGDRVVAVADWTVTPDAAGQRGVEQRLSNLGPGDVSLKVAGPAGERLMTLHPVLSCGYSITIADQDDPNAVADGSRIVVNRGMLRFVKSDDELALIIAHELAHDSERHIRSKQANATAGLVAGGAVDVLFALGGINTQGAFMRAGQAAGAGFHSVEFEAEADYVGVYYMARAGYNTEEVADFWRRYAAEYPASSFVKSDHPTAPARYLSIARARTEIEAKRKASAPLLPERKKTTAPSTDKPAAATAAGETKPAA